MVLSIMPEESAVGLDDTADAALRSSFWLTATARCAGSPQGLRAHPALVEARQQRVTLAKLVASLRIPLDESEGAGRTQQRVGVVCRRWGWPSEAATPAGTGAHTSGVGGPARAR